MAPVSERLSEARRRGGATLSSPLPCLRLANTAAPARPRQCLLAAAAARRRRSSALSAAAEKVARRAASAGPGRSADLPPPLGESVRRDGVTERSARGASGQADTDSDVRGRAVYASGGQSRVCRRRVSFHGTPAACSARSAAKKPAR